MKPEINFYQTDEAQIKSLPTLLLKVLEEKKKVLIFCSDQNLIREIDTSLWNFGRNKFIPHATIFDQEFSLQRQPILITNQEENLNQADYLIFLDEPSAAFIRSFLRIFYFFEDHQFVTAKSLAAKLRPLASKFSSYKKESGKWIKS